MAQIWYADGSGSPLDSVIGDGTVVRDVRKDLEVIGMRRLRWVEKFE